MSKTHKRLLSWVLSIIMMISVIPVPVSYADGITVLNTTEQKESDIDTEDELITALTAGGEVVLGGDIAVDTKVNVPDGTTIDLNGKTLYINVEDSTYGNVTITNGNIVIGKDDVHVCNGYFIVNADKTLKVDGVKINSADGGIKGYALFHLKTGARLELAGSEINITENEYAAGYIVYAGEATASVDIKDSKVIGNKISGIVHATTLIEDSTFTITNPAEHGINRSAVTINDSDVTISGGSGRGITAEHGDLVINGNSNVTVFNMSEATIELRGDKNMTVADTATVALDKAVNNTTSGTVTGNVTVDSTCGSVAKIGTQGYATLAEAIAAANGDTVTLLADVELTEVLTVPADYTVTLDLNGKTISQEKAQTGAYSMIVNNGNLTIEDSVGTGKISYADTAELTSYVNYVSNTILNNGTLTVKGGTIENVSVQAVADNGYPHAIDTNGTLYVEGGVITCKYYSAIRIWCTTNETDVTISGGTINGAVDLHNVNGNANKGTLTITGGTFNKNASAANIRVLAFGADLDDFVAAITGGTFDSGIIIRNYVGTELNSNVYEVSGGTFGEAIPEEYCAEGFIPKDNGDGTYGVRKAPKAHFETGAYASTAPSKPREHLSINVYDVYAEESLVIKVYDENGNLIAISTYRDYDIDVPDVYRYPLTSDRLSVNIVVSGKEAGSWANEWIIVPNAGNIPAIFEVYADGVLTDTWTTGFKSDEEKVDYIAFNGTNKVSVTTTAGETAYYATLADAIAAAVAGDTVKLLTNVTETSAVVLDKAITLDGNGFTLTSTATRAINANCAGEVTIKNLTIVGNANTERAINVIQKAAKLTIDNVTAEGFKYTVNVDSSSVGSNIAIKNSTISGYAALNITGNNTTVTVDNSELTGVNDASYHETNAFGVIAIGAENVVNVSVTVTNSTLTATSANGNRQFIVAASNVANSVFNISGTLNTVNGDVFNGIPSAVTATFPKEYADEINAQGYAYIDNGNGTVTVAKAVASVNAKNYTSINAAQLAAMPGDVIVLLADWTESITLYKGVTLDLNGYTLTADLYFVATVGNHVIDSTNSTGMLKVAGQTSVVLASDNKQLAVWDAANSGYLFSDVVYKQQVTTRTENTVKLLFLPEVKNENIIALLADGNEDNKVTFNVVITWGANDSHNYVYTDYVDVVYGSYSNGRFGQVFTLNISGVSGKDDLKLQAQIISSTGVKMNGVVLDGTSAGNMIQGNA